MQMHASNPIHPDCQENAEDILNTMEISLQASEHQSDLYRASSFWAQAAQDIVNEIKHDGIDRFRSLHTPLKFFVPTYGRPGNRLSAETIEQVRNCMSPNKMALAAVDQFVSGYSAALADFRVAAAADDPARRPFLQYFSESDVGNPGEQFEFDDRKFSRSALNYLLGLCLLKRHLDDEPISTVVEVGGGFGSLGEILLKGDDPTTRYIDFDIPPNSAITQYYLSEIFGAQNVAGYLSQEKNEKIEIDQLPAASAFCNWQIEQLEGKVDLFVNFISFQEMEPPIVANYLSHVDRLKTRWILLRNMREGKQLKTATSIGVEKPILSENYAQMLPNYELIDSNVLPFGYRTVDGFHSELLLFKRR